LTRGYLINGLGIEMIKSMGIQLKRSSELTEAEEARLGALSGVCFTDGDDGSSGYQWADSDWGVLGLIDGQIVSNVGLIKREIIVAGTPLWVGGVGGVMTDPGYQKQGLAAALLKESHTVMRDHLRVDYGMLFCSTSMVHYYQKSGWQVIECKVAGENRGDKVIFPFPIMVICLSGQPWPSGEVNI
jgi:GNAT superfamily N-acetyltransferase